MKKVLVIIAISLTLMVNGVNAQQKVIKVNGNSNAFCGFNLSNKFDFISPSKSYTVREAAPGDKSGIYDVVEGIKKAIGVSTPFQVFITANEDNAFATIGEGGTRIILADQMFLVDVNKNSGTTWSAVSILAHEIGHHIAGFTRRPTKPEAELDADYWSGYALQKLGSSRIAATKSIMTYGTENDTPSHPSKYRRAKVIEAGWDDAKRGSYDRDRCESC